MKVAITGATGFLGRNLKSQLEKKGAQIRVLTRDKNKAVSLFGNSVDIIEGNILDQSSLSSLLNGMDYLFHLASEIREKQTMKSVNVDGMNNVLRAVEAANLKKLIYVSSAGVAGQGETYFINENTICSPENEYERTKLEAEKIIQAWSVTRSTPYVILRPTIVFGEGKTNSNDSFYQLIRNVQRRRCFTMSRGKGYANYVYVKDVVEVLVFLAMLKEANNNTYIINDVVSMKKMLHLMQLSLGVSYNMFDLPFTPVMVLSSVVSRFYPDFVLSPSRVRAMSSSYLYSNEKLSRLSGFKLSYGISAGLDNTVAWLKEKRWL